MVFCRRSQLSKRFSDGPDFRERKKEESEWSREGVEGDGINLSRLGLPMGTHSAPENLSSLTTNQNILTR